LLDGGVLVDLIYDLDAHKPAAPPRLFRSAHADRTVTITDARMVASDPSLWTKDGGAE
jgi:hypothetical protein